MLSENILKIQKLLKKYNKVWFMCNKSGSDNFFRKYITDKLDTATYAVISKNKCYLLVHELDKNNIEEIIDDNITVIIYTNSEQLNRFLEDIIDDLRFINQISLTYSTMGDVAIDILGHGEYIRLTKKIKDIYFKYNKKIRFESAEKIIYELSSTKTQIQIDRMKLVASISSKILEKTFAKMQSGMTEIEIANTIRQITENIMKKNIGVNEIFSYKLAWDNCPIVLTGINLLKGGHSIPSEKILKKGDTIYFDFGICVKFIDGEELCSDIQRMGYVLKDTEEKPPKNVQKVFNTLVKAIEDGMDEMKPGVKAYIIDDIVRGEIIKNGYPDYNHATGHPVGHLVHDLGAIITSKISKNANLEFVKYGVYTLEPRIQIENGGSIEEMILVTEYGGLPLCEPQNEIYLVR